MTIIELSDNDSFELLFRSDNHNSHNSPHPVFVDIGAYNGDTIVKALNINPNLKIIAIEPIKSLANEISQKFQSNKNVTVINKAAWYNKQNIQFNEYEGWSKGLSTIKPMLTQLRPINKFTSHISKYDIEGDLLDNILYDYNIDAVDYIKIDTEGSEDEVLVGFTKYKKGTRFHIESHIINLENILQRLLEMNANIEKITLNRDTNIKEHVLGTIIGEFQEPIQQTKQSGQPRTKIQPNKSEKNKSEKHGAIKTYIGDVDRRQWILSKCKEGEKILDIGSADGWIFKNTPFISNVTSIDLDIYDIPNFQQMDAHHLKFSDKSFDTIILGEILEHVENPVQVLKGANRVGKRILMTIPDEINWSPENYPFETIEQGMKRRNLTLEEIVKVSNPNAKELYTKDDHKHLFHTRYYTEETLKHDLESAGITDYEMIRLQYGKPQWSFFLVEANTNLNTNKNIAKKGPKITIGPTIPVILNDTIENIIEDKLKIAVISTPFFGCPPSGYGGLEQVVWDLVYGLDELGHSVTLFAPDGSKTPEHGNLITTGIACKSVNINWFEEEKKRYNTYKDLILPEKYDVVIDSTWFGFIYLSKIKNNDLRVMHVHHSGYSWDSPPPVKKPNLISISKWMKSYTEEYFKQKGFNVHSEYIYNGIDLDKYPFKAKKSENLLFVGRLSTLKQPDVAIDVARKTRHKLDIIGSASFVDSTDFVKKLEKSIEEDPDINIYKDVSHDLKIEKMQNAKCLIFPSKFGEPLGLVAQEAMACGTPVIATRDGAIPEIVKHGKTGFICDTVQEMVDTIYKIHTIKPEDCRRHVEDNFSRLKMSQDYERLCHRLMKGDDW